MEESSSQSPLGYRSASGAAIQCLTDRRGEGRFWCRGSAADDVGPRSWWREAAEVKVTADYRRAAAQDTRPPPASGGHPTPSSRRFAATPESPVLRPTATVCDYGFEKRIGSSASNGARRFDGGNVMSWVHRHPPDCRARSPAGSGVGGHSGGPALLAGADPVGSAGAPGGLLRHSRTRCSAT